MLHHLFLTAPSMPKTLSITRVLEAGIELNWLPPTEPNGEVHYVIYYTPEGGTEQSMDTGSDLTHYNLTGLERNRVYTNISVQAVNSVGRSIRSAVLAQYNHTPSGEQTFRMSDNTHIKFNYHKMYLFFPHVNSHSDRCRKPYY